MGRDVESCFLHLMTSLHVAPVELRRGRPTCGLGKGGTVAQRERKIPLSEYLHYRIGLGRYSHTLKRLGWCSRFDWAGPTAGDDRDVLAVGPPYMSFAWSKTLTTCCSPRASCSGSCRDERFCQVLPKSRLEASPSQLDVFSSAVLWFSSGHGGERKKRGVETAIGRGAALIIHR